MSSSYHASSSIFQSTLPARGATLMGIATASVNAISIHAPRTGSDGAENPQERMERKISIHAPRTGSDPTRIARYCCAKLFQSTLPARGATPSGSRYSQSAYFNPRSPHGERRFRRREARNKAKFQSTLPARGATIFGHQYVRCEPISIHAPRTGSDRVTLREPGTASHFNPRSPHGERH